MEANVVPVIAIDGPAASGKSTVGEAVARALGFLYVDTGAMYRAVTQAALARGLPVEDEAAVVALTDRLAIVIQPDTVGDGRQYTVLVDGEDVTWALRSPDVDAHVSQISAYPEVRRLLVRAQQRLAAAGRVVMVGRDIGTVVLPTAPLKVYLDASAAERARRRHRELLARGHSADYEAILAGIRARDAIDSRRAASPLQPAADAVILDTDGKSIAQVVQCVLDLAAQRFGLAVPAS
jgi:cytidylate kinase